MNHCFSKGWRNINEPGPHSQCFTDPPLTCLNTRHTQTQCLTHCQAGDKAAIWANTGINAGTLAHIVFLRLKIIHLFIEICSYYPESKQNPCIKKRLKDILWKPNIHVFYGLLLDPHARVNLGESILLYVYSYNFVIVLITCVEAPDRFRFPASSNIFFRFI